MKTNSDLTLFNRYVVNGEEHYKATPILRVAWFNTKAVNVLKSGLIDSDSVTVYIPYARGTNYVSPVAWEKLDAKVKYWTLKPGDVIVKGVVSDTIGTAFTLTDLKKKYDNVVRITTVDLNDIGSESLWHWRIGAK